MSIATNEMQIFNNSEFGRVRILMIDSEPWFVGKDVAQALEYSDTDQALRKNVENEDKLTRPIDGLGQMRNMTIINESGLYALIFGSKLESAKRFKHWVTSEVLPAIRKTGSYSAPVMNTIPVKDRHIEISTKILRNFSYLTGDQIKELVPALVSYVESGTEPDALDNTARLMFEFVREDLNEQRIKYDRKCAINRENGRKGGRPRKK